MIASAPGKILWMGGYSVLQRPNVAFVTGVDKRVYAQSLEVEDDFAHFELPQFNVSLAGKLDGGKIVFAGNPSKEELKKVKFAKVATETCACYFDAKGEPFKGVEIKSVSDPAFGFEGSKAGLGSSAAATVAITASLFELHDKNIPQNLGVIHRIAQYAHSNAQGKVGSGFDVAAACFGGCKYVRYSPSLIPTGELNGNKLVETLEKEWDCITEKVDLPKGFIAIIASFEGESASTREMVKKYNAFKAEKPDEFAALMNELNAANEEAIELMKKIDLKANENPRDYLNVVEAVDENRAADLTFKKFYEAFKKGRLLLKEFGEKSGAVIEPQEYSKLIDETEKNGAFAAKLPGSGGGDAIAALCLSKNSKEKVETFWKNYSRKKLAVLNVGISNSGVRRENALPLF